MTQWLIDAKTLKDSFCEACSTKTRYKRTIEECRAYMNERGNKCFKMRLINNAPVVDIEPVRHGRWENAKAAFHKKCSYCKSILHMPRERNYCPNCGAKMGLEVQDEG